MKTRIMYIECKAKGLRGGDARIGRVTYSKSGQSLQYQGRTFAKIPGGSAKANYFEVATGQHYWISGPKRNGADRLYGERVPVSVDPDVEREYWTEIRSEAENNSSRTISRNRRPRRG